MIYNANINEAQITFPKDGIICQKYIAGIPGGRALDVDGYPLSVIYAGTPVIVKDGNYKPFPLTQSGESLPTAAVSAQTGGSAIVGDVYEGVTSDTAGAVKCALADKTVVYLSDTKATGTADAEKTYYTKDTANTIFIGEYDADGNTVYKLGSLPANHTYAGLLYKSVKKNNAAASIMTQGVVNESALYFAISSIKSALQAAFPAITFVNDEEAVSA